jgi:energy-coupling factor transport system substrate-specific component
MRTNPWSFAIVTAAALLSVFVFAWPLFITYGDQAGLAQGVFIGLMPLLLLVMLVEFNTGSIGARQMAILGLLIALNSVIRLLGAGVSGIETVFFLIVIGGFVFGASFGFVLGAGSLLVSALLGAGVGPWLPFQMMASGLVGLGAGLLGTSTHRLRFSKIFLRSPIEVALMCGYAILASFGYGGLMTLWNWPFLAGQGSSLSYVAGAPLSQNLIAFFKYEIFTGGLLWDFGRAVTTALLIALTGKTLLATLRRAANKAGIKPS